MSLGHQNQNLGSSNLLPLKKGKRLKKAPCWEHFEQIHDEAGVVVKEKCKYCASIYNCHSKTHGTSSLRNHVLHCLKSPNSKESRHVLLTLKPKLNVEAHDSQTLGIIGTWKFDQEAIKNALAEMCIYYELPFKFVEREGF